MTCGSQPQDYGPKYTTAAAITNGQQHSVIQGKLKKVKHNYEMTEQDGSARY
jgi:hypothetical protein